MDQFEQRLSAFESDTKHAVDKIEMRIDNLTKNVEKHNSVIERTFQLEKQAAVIENAVKSAHHRIDSLEDKNGQ